MTFEQFQATRRWSDDLAAAAQSAQWGDGTSCGQLYTDSLCIESALNIEGATGEYVITIGNMQMFGALETLERKLYDFAVSEGYFE